MDEKKCPCMQKKTYSECCKVFHLSPALIHTPTQLVYARYSAFVLKQPEFIRQTMKEPALKFFDSTHILNTSLVWAGIDILSIKYTDEKKTNCVIKFSVKCKNSANSSQYFTVLETGLFEKYDSTWFYVDALHIHQENISS